jgi:hypothetical protein
MEWEVAERPTDAVNRPCGVVWYEFVRQSKWTGQTSTQNQIVFGARLQKLHARNSTPLPFSFLRESGRRFRMQYEAMLRGFLAEGAEMGQLAVNDASLSANHPVNAQPRENLGGRDAAS